MYLSLRSFVEMIHLSPLLISVNHRVAAISRPYFLMLSRAERSRYARVSGPSGNLINSPAFDSRRVVSKHDGTTGFSLKLSYIFGFSTISVLTDAGYYAVGLRHRDLLEHADAATVATFRLADSRLALLAEEAGLVHVCRWKDVFFTNFYRHNKYTQSVRL